MESGIDDLGDLQLFDVAIQPKGKYSLSTFA